MIKGGFPDFIAFRAVVKSVPVPARTVESNEGMDLINPAINQLTIKVREVIGVECKGGTSEHNNNKLDNDERIAADFYVNNRIFDKFYIATKENKEIVYLEWLAQN